MKQTEALLIATILSLGMTGLIQAEPNTLGVKLDTAFVSKHLWHGFAIFDDEPAFQPGVNFDLYDTGFSFNVQGFFADAGQVEIHQEIDYTLAYDCLLFETTDCQTNLRFNFTLYDFRRWRIDKHEVGAAFAWPNICPAGVVPGYYIGCMWPRTHYGTDNLCLQGDASGFIHVLSLAYPLTVPGFLPDSNEQVFNLSTDLTYNDGCGANHYGPTADHDWSHMTFGVSTNVPVADLTLTPAVYYQLSMDDSVNEDDELVARVSLSYSF